MKRKNSLLVGFSISLIKKIWQYKIGPVYKKKYHILCRFYPDCSHYSILALQKYGFFKGWLLTYKRFKRCTNDNTESCIDYP